MFILAEFQPRIFASGPDRGESDLGGWGRVGHSQRAPSEEASDRGRGVSDVEPSHPRLTEGMRTVDP